MTVQSLGYMGVRSTRLEDWSNYGPRVLGMQRVERSSSSLAFRMDDRKQRLVVEKGSHDGVSFFGWEVADAAALSQIGARLDAAGIPVKRGEKALADARFVSELVVCDDPIGNRIELFWGAQQSSEVFSPGRSISGFRTGPLGMGHVVFTVESADLVHRMLDFYEKILGFRLTDYYSQPFEARFLHVNGRHHALAFVQGPKNAFHHLMTELYSFDDVGQGYDLAMVDEKVATTLGRHTSDYMTSFYSWTPSRFMIEYGWGGRSIDPETWKAHERNEGPSLWGHDRNWTTPEMNQRAREMRMRNASNGMRAPVQVMEGNFQVQQGVCPWWDQVTREHLVK